MSLRVLFTCLAHSTHYYPLVPIAWALRTAGHEVRVACHPDLVETVTQAGLTAVPIEFPGWAAADPAEQAALERLHDQGAAFVQDFDFAGRDPGQWTWERLLALEHIMTPSLHAVMNNDAMIDELVGYARAWRPDLVVWEAFTIAGAITATAVGAAHARLVAGPDVATRARQAFLRQATALPEEHREDPTAEWIGWTLERLGCPVGFDEELVTGQWTIDSGATAQLDLELRTVPVRHVPYHGPSVAPDWLREPATRPRVCLTFGASGPQCGVALPEALEAMADLDAEIVATLGHTEPGERVVAPDNARVVDFVPLNDLLPSCAVVAHHGGLGTKATAELHGVPQIILAFGWDTQVVAEGVEKFGAGVSLPAATATADSLRREVERVLSDPEFAMGARRLRERALSLPSPNEIVPTLERLTARRRPSGLAARRG